MLHCFLSAELRSDTVSVPRSQSELWFPFQRLADDSFLPSTDKSSFCLFFCPIGSVHSPQPLLQLECLDGLGVRNVQSPFLEEALVDRGGCGRGHELGSVYSWNEQRRLFHLSVVVEITETCEGVQQIDPQIDPIQKKNSKRIHFFFFLTMIFLCNFLSTAAKQKADARKAEVMQKKTLLGCFSLSFSHIKHYVFILLDFLLYFRGSCESTENDRKKGGNHSWFFSERTVVSVSQILPRSLRINV